MMWNRSSRTRNKRSSSFAEEQELDLEQDYGLDSGQSERRPKRRSRRAQQGSAQESQTFATAQQAYECALTLLNYRDYSERKMLERLIEKGASEEQATEALEKLKEYGLINEERYVARLYEGWLAKRCYGRQHLRAELAKRGVCSELTQSVLEQFTPELELQQAQNATELFLQRNRGKLKELPEGERERRVYLSKLYAAGARFLAARGFAGAAMFVLQDKLSSLFSQL